MRINSCLLIANSITDADRDFLLAGVDRYVADGMEPLAAQRKAAQDLLAAIEGERAALQQPKYTTPPGGFQLRDFGIGAQTIEAVQDRYNRWKQAIEDVRSQGGTISEDNDFYRAEERYWGSVGARIEDFKGEVEQWVKELTDDQLDLTSVALYAYAQHAKDRNAYIASIRPSMPDGGSGMTNQEADDILDEARMSGLEPALQRHTAKLRSFIQGTRDHLLNEGLITQGDYDNWTNNMASYVPLRGLPENSTLIDKKMPGTGQGFNIRGKEYKQMLGRRSQAKQIIEHVIADRTRAYIRGGKNEVLRHFLKFVLDNPSTNLWRVESVESKPVMRVDANGDPEVVEVDKVVADDRTITVKDGGREIRIHILDDKLREQMQNLNAETIGTGIGALLFVNRMLSRLYTSLSPVFTVVNLLRDVQTATFGAIDELGFLGAAKMFKHMAPAAMESFAAEAGRMSQDYRDFRSTGGKTGFFDFKTVDDLSKEMATLAARVEMSALDPRKAAPKLMELVEKANSGIENIARLAAFKTAREMGKTRAEAGHIAKNLTVNFNRKGSKTPYLAAWFLFFNPAVQGTTRMLQALKSPKVLATLGVAMAASAALALRNAGMGEDDDGIPWWDKIPDETKERNLIFVLPPGATEGEQVPGSKVGRYVKVPMPYGYNVFNTIANQVVDVWRNSQDASKGRETWDALVKTFGAFMGSWVPVAEVGGAFENSKSLALAATPDAFNPVMQNILNVNPFGRPLTPEGSNTKGLPESSKAFTSQQGTLFQKAAQGMNRLAGGDTYTPPPGPLSLFDLSPGQLENLVRGYMGGPATFAMDVMNSMYARTALERPELDPRRLPFAKQLYGVIDAETDRMIAYSRMEKAQEIVNRAKAAKKAGDDEGYDRIEEESGPIAALGSKLTGTTKSLSSLRKEELGIMADDELSDSQKMTQLLELNTRRRQTLQDFNAAYSEALIELRQQRDERRKQR